MDKNSPKIGEIRHRIDRDLLERSIPGVIIFAILWPLIFWPIGFEKILPTFSWGLAAALAGISVLRLILQYFSPRFYQKSATNWLICFAALSLSQAALWGLLFAFSLTDSQFASVAPLVFIAIGGIASGAMSALLPRLWLSISNICILLLPAILSTLFVVPNYPLGVLITIYLGYLMLLGRRANAEYIRGFKIEYQLEKQRKALEKLNKIDPLTQIYNRGHFNTAFEHHWHAGIRSLKEQSLLLIDVDHFKSVNDQFGHLVGDECLVYVASLIHETAKRNTDVIARFGGEEFAVLLSDTPLKEAREMAEAIRTNIQSKPFCSGSIELSITASIGVSCIQPYPEINPNLLIDLADQALYQAKNEGRNCVRYMLLETDKLN